MIVLTFAMKKNYLKWNIGLFKYKKKTSGFAIIGFLNNGLFCHKNVPYNYKKFKKEYLSTNNNSNNTNLNNNDNLKNNKKNKDIIISYNYDTTFINQIKKLAIENFDGKTSEILNRTTLEYIDYKGNKVRLDSRTWAYLKYNKNLIINKKLYKGICIPLMGVSALLNFKTSTSKLNKKNLNKLIKNCKDINPIKSSDHKTYAALLTEADITLILKLKAADFDLKLLRNFTENFNNLVKSSYVGTHIPLFWVGEQLLGVDHDDSITDQTLSNTIDTFVKTTEVKK